MKTTIHIIRPCDATLDGIDYVEKEIDVDDPRLDLKRETYNGEPIDCIRCTVCGYDVDCKEWYNGKCVDCS